MKVPNGGAPAAASPAPSSEALRGGVISVQPQKGGGEPEDRNAPANTQTVYSTSGAGGQRIEHSHINYLKYIYRENVRQQKDPRGNNGNSREPAARPSLVITIYGGPIERQLHGATGSEKKHTSGATDASTSTQANGER